MWQTLANSLFPLFCRCCGKEGHAWCRPDSELAHWPLCFWCRNPYHTELIPKQCTRPLPLVTLGPYADPVLRKLIVDWKYEGHWAISDDWAKALAAQLPVAAPLCPVPLHWRRAMARGYNQAEVLAKQIGRAVGQPTVPTLTRIRATSPQALLPDSERGSNVRDAFQRNPKVVCPPKIWLVDDVVTTGSTAKEAIRTLQPDVQIVGVVAIAYAKPEDDSIGRNDYKK